MRAAPESLEGVLKLLKFRNRPDLVQPLRRAWLESDEGLAGREISASPPPAARDLLAYPGLSYAPTAE